MYEIVITRRLISMRLILIGFSLLSVPLPAVPVFIGTNTVKNSTSKGIYSAEFDPATGRLSEPVLAAEYANPGFLALHPGKPVLYASGLPNRPSDQGLGSVGAFRIEGTSLKFLGETSSGGRNGCHLAVDGSGRTVAVAHYGDGRITTLRLDGEGVPIDLASVIANEGSGPNKSRQEGPHAHGVYFDKSNRHLLVPDLGLDQVLVYSFDAETSKLGDSLPSLSTSPGAGPRHLAFSPDEKHVYVINELDNTVLVAAHEDGKFKVLQNVATLPAGYEGQNTTAEVEVHPNGRFVYASNRGHHTLVVYQRDPVTGLLKLLQHQDCGGKVPRHFKIADGGKWLLCAHQESNTVSVLPLDPETGGLGDPVSTVAVPAPTCLLFVP
jgi:6-phosphogluconolactonase